MFSTLASEIYHLPMQRPEGHFQAWLGFTGAPFAALQATMAQYLHQTELNHYATSVHDHCQESFLRSRYLAKQVLVKYLAIDPPAQIEISAGVFNQPLVRHPSCPGVQISLSHTAAEAACLAFPEAHPMGLDLELIRSSNAEDMRSQMTAPERSLLRVVTDDEATFYTRLWTMKEALSKVLKTGLMTPMEVYEVDTLATREGYIVGTFRNFGQYKAVSFAWKDHLCSLVLPRASGFLFFSSLLANGLE